jgi:hypothetical protein
MDTLPRVKLSGALEGDYVILLERAGGRLTIAPQQPDGLPKLVTLKRTTWACPTQWEGKLGDGRTLYARCRHGELSVGIGAGIDAAIANGMSKDAFYFDYVEDAAMSFEELRAHLHGLLELPAGLEAEDQREPNWDLEAFGKIFDSEESADPEPARESGEGEGALETPERVGAGLREAEVRDWTCFSCGKKLTQAHEGDYFHTDPDSTCFDPVPVPTSLVEVSSAEMTGTEAKSRGAQPAHGRSD